MAQRANYAILYLFMSMARLGRHFGVPTYRISRMKAAGFVKFKHSRRGGFPSWVARPIDLVDAPIYFPVEAAKFAGRKTGRTIRRWHKAGLIELTQRRPGGRWYASPRQMLEAKRVARALDRSGPKPDPKKLFTDLENLIDDLPVREKQRRGR